MGVFTATLPDWKVAPIPVADLRTMVDALTALTAAWTTYVPTWTASAGAVAIGNGTLTGRYRQLGDTVDFSINWTAGGTTTFGTAGAYWIFGLPVTNALNYVWPLRMFDTGVLEYAGFASAAAGAGTLELFKPVSGRVVNNSPFTFGSGDSLWLNGSYEIA